MLKTIGLLGGTSWPSTIDYYRTLNVFAQEQLGGFHSANLLVRSIDYHEIKSRYYDRWAEIPPLLEQEIKDFVALGPDCLLICNNTLHKAFDDIEGHLALSIPVFHIVKATGRAAQARNFTRLLLLGTKYTMEDGFYKKRLEQFGLSVETPNEEDRVKVQAIQSQLAKGVVREEFGTFLAALIRKHSKSSDAVVLACTELPLAVDAEGSSMPILNPTELQCKEAFDFAIGSAAG